LSREGPLLFGTAGVPRSTRSRATVSGLEHLRELGLDAMELEYVRGSFPGEETARKIGRAAKETGVRLTAHGPYYINLNSDDGEKREASRQRIYKTAYYGGLSGAESITFHAGFYQKSTHGETYATIREELASVVSSIRRDGITLDVRPELTGKASQFGSLDELCRLSTDIPGVYPCIDWSHLHARTGGFNDTASFDAVLKTLRDRLGEEALSRCHMHISGIDYSEKGERKHLDLDESDFNYRDLLRVLRNEGIGGFLICESPSLETDALKLKETYDRLAVA